MNLLFLPKVLPRANIIGGPILVHHRIKNLSKMGHKITVISPAYTDEDREDKSLEEYCEKIILIDSDRKRTEEEVEALYKKLNRPKFFLNGDGGYLAEIDAVLKASLQEKHFDALIAEYSMPGQYLEANKDIIPKDTMSIISVHECYTRAFRQRMEKGEALSEETINELSAYEFKMYKAVDRVMPLTREDGDILINYAPQLKDKIRVVPHGVDTRFFVPPKGRNPNSKKILFLGNYLHHPNVDAVKNFMTHCWEKILAEVPEAKFYGIGFRPPQELLDLNSANITIKEGGEDVRPFYWECDVFVAPLELGGGFRGKLLEALACGVPVVSTSLGTFGIHPVHGKEMLIADDYNLFAGHVIRLLKDAGFRQEMAANGLALAERFDHIHAAEKLDEVLKEVDFCKMRK